MKNLMKFYKEKFTVHIFLFYFYSFYMYKALYLFVFFCENRVYCYFLFFNCFSFFLYDICFFVSLCFDLYVLLISEPHSHLSFLSFISSFFISSGSTPYSFPFIINIHSSPVSLAKENL